MSETLAQYSALMVMEKEYGQQNIRKFLKHELDGYLRGRGGELRKEPTLMLVQREPYVWYNKGSLVMYALRDYLGEDKLNAALRKFLLDKRYAEGPFPDTRQFVAYLREAAPSRDAIGNHRHAGTDRAVRQQSGQRHVVAHPGQEVQSAANAQRAKSEGGRPGQRNGDGFA
jgi:hypothetical protein